MSDSSACSVVATTAKTAAKSDTELVPVKKSTTASASKTPVKPTAAAPAPTKRDYGF